MDHFELDTERFSSRLVDHTVVVHLKSLALEIVTDVDVKTNFVDHLKLVNDSPDARGYVQINDSGWDSQNAVDGFVEFILRNDVPHVSRGSYHGMFHDVIAARFRHSIGDILFRMIKLKKPAIAGLQGQISGEYLGLSLAFDSRIATADTTVSFDNARTGLPASPGVTYLMPRYIGLGKTMSLVQRGATIDADEALSLGLISDIVDDPEELENRCVKSIRDVTADNPHVASFHRQNIFPSPSEISIALERYYEAAAKSILILRSNHDSRNQ